jgi:hypothetical protein
LSVDADVPASEDLFGKVVGDLQTGVTVSSDGISGTLKSVSDYTGFSSDVSMQSGHYLAIHCAVPDMADATITVEIVNGFSGPRTLDTDGLIVLRIADKDTQSIRVVASKEGFAPVTRTFSLSELTLA